MSWCDKFLQLSTKAVLIPYSNKIPPSTLPSVVCQVSGKLLYDGCRNGVAHLSIRQIIWNRHHHTEHCTPRDDASEAYLYHQNTPVDVTNSCNCSVIVAAGLQARSCVPRYKNNSPHIFYVAFKSTYNTRNYSCGQIDLLFGA